tara:strand:+ start:1747 stop:2136 length:390 start_codon:yes stop_codon:yes gene_type:complete
MNGAFTPGLMKKMKHALPKRYCSNPAKQMGKSTHALGHNRSENVLMKTSYPDSYLMQTGDVLIGPDTKLDQQIKSANAYTYAANSGTEFNTDSFYTGGEIFGESNKSRPKQSRYPGNLPGVKTRVEKNK